MLVTLVFCPVFLAVPSENVWAMPFNPAVNYAEGVRPRSVAVGGFDGDGNLDLAVANYYSDDVSILLNAATPAITPPAAGTACPVWAVLLAGIAGGIGLLMLRRRSRVRESV